MRESLEDLLYIGQVVDYRVESKVNFHRTLCFLIICKLI